MEKWEKLKILSVVISTIFIPILLGYLGHIFTRSMKQREIQGRFVELGVSILQEEPKESTENLRKWAVEVLDKYSGVPFNQNTKEELIREVPIPKAYEPSRRAYETLGNRELFIDNTRFQLMSFKRIDEHYTCTIQIKPSKDISSITITALPMPLPIYKSIFTLVNESLENRNYPISKTFSIEPGKTNKLEITLYPVGKEKITKEIISFSIRFDVGFGEFYIRFSGIEVPDKTASPS